MVFPVLVLAWAAALLGLSVVMMLAGVEPFATWFYPLAWSSTLAAGDAVVRLRTGRWYLLGDPAFAATVFAWSVPFWLFFELLNLRLANWYYVFVPDVRAARLSGIVLSFATVLPAILLSRRILDAWGAFEDVRWPALGVRPSLPRGLQAVGVLFFTLALAWPHLFFPLVWGGVTLLVDPWVYRRDARRALMGVLERGRPALVLQLLVGGLAIGFLWELYNSEARGKWIYTVPGLEEVKLFEMPVLGFLGFPVLALDGWAVWSALVTLGLAVEPGTLGRLRRRTLAFLAVPVVGGCLGVLSAMERYTIASRTPRLVDLVGAEASRIRRAGHDAFTLAEADPAELGPALGVEADAARRWIERARLTVLRGIGTERARDLEAVGVRNVRDLARSDPARLIAELSDHGVRDVRAARVRVWIRAAEDLLLRSDERGSP